MPSIIDGRKWLEARVAYLEAQLAGDNQLSDEERKVIEAETVELKAELAASRRRFRRLLLWGGRTTPM